LLNKETCQHENVLVVHMIIMLTKLCIILQTEVKV